jgi:hypothetical protein
MVDKDAPSEGEHSDLKHIMRTALGVVIGIGAAAAVAYVVWQIAHEHLGYFAYTGLTQMQVAKVAHELDMRYKILSRVVGSNGPGHRYYRGVYTSKDGGMPLYYKFEYFPNREAELNLYPMLFETWTTSGNNDARMTFPSTGERAISQSRYEKKEMLNS